MQIKSKSKIAKLEKKLKEIKSGKWNETPERIKQLKSKLVSLKKE